MSLIGQLCQKTGGDENKRAPNTTPVEIGEITAHAGIQGRGRRNDLNAVKEAIEAGMNLSDLQSNFFQEFAMYGRFLTQSGSGRMSAMSERAIWHAISLYTTKLLLSEQ